MKNLYRRYRPLTLSDVVGQEQVTEPLVNSLAANRVAHAYLFVGPRGCGKTSVARILAHEVNGFSYTLEDDYVDIVEIDGASNRGIDNIRELREKAAIAPTLGKYKVYIIDEVHMLTKEAFNALLKTLEEPPEHVIFIMATTDVYKVPITITSRAQTFTFKLADADTMFKHLKVICEKEKIQISDDALRVVVKRGGGSFRDSLSLLDQISTLSSGEITKELVVSAMGLPEDDIISELFSSYVAGDVVKITTLLRELLNSGVKPETLAEEMISIIIESPKPELMPLLSKLPEVKDPFAEAKLLVAVIGGLSVSSSVRLVSSERHTLGSRENRPMGEPLGAVRNIRSSSTNQTSMTPEEADKPHTNHGSAGVVSEKEVSKTSEEADKPRHADFDWGKFIEVVKGMNDAVYSQIIKAGHGVSGNVLHIYPDKKIAKTILARDNNKKILIDAAGGMRIEIHEVGENPNKPKDALISKISDIMGGEVENDGGGNPF